MIKETPSINHHIVKTSYSIFGYKNVATKQYYIGKVCAKLDEAKIDVKEIHPVLLPPLLKFVFKDLKVGDTLFFSKNYLFNEMGHFAGFRKDDLSLTLDPKIRKELVLTSGKRYKVEIDTLKNKITFFTS